MSDRPAMISDMVAYEVEFGTYVRAEWWTDRMNADGAAGSATPTTSSVSDETSISPNQKSSGVQATPTSAGTTGSGGGSVADLMRELREASDYAWELTKHIAPSVSNRMPSCTGVITQLDNAIVGLEKRAEAAESKVKELEEQIATLTRQLGEEREACDAMRRLFVDTLPPLRSHGGTYGVYVRNQEDALKWCHNHDARREREKQNTQAGNPAESRSDGSASGRGNDEPGREARYPVLQVRPSTAASTGRQQAIRGSGTDDRQGVEQPGNDGGASQASRSKGCGSEGEAGQVADPPATVTDEDLRVALAWQSERLAPGETLVESVATLIARIRHQRDGEIRELVEWIAYATDASRVWRSMANHCPATLHVNGAMLDSAAALVAKHGGGK